QRAIGDYDAHHEDYSHARLYVKRGAGDVKCDQDADQPKWHGDHDDQRAEIRSKLGHHEQIDKNGGETQAVTEIAKRLVHTLVFTGHANFHALGAIQCLKLRLNIGGDSANVSALRVDHDTDHVGQIIVNQLGWSSIQTAEFHESPELDRFRGLRTAYTDVVNRFEFRVG